MEEPEEFKGFKFEPVGKCIVCGGNSYKVVLRRNYLNQEFQWVRCRECSFVFQNPKLTLEVLRNLYNSFSYLQDKDVDKDKRVGYHDYISGEDFRLRQSAARIKKITRFVAPPSRLLDIACATGFFMKVARDHGYVVEGIDISEKLAKWGNKKYDLNIRPRSFEESEFEEQSYDLITIWGAADSNFYDPLLAYSKINKILKPKGYLFFNFHDFDHPFRFLKGGTFKRNPTAIYNFNRKNLKVFLQKVGFHVIKVDQEFQYTDLQHLLNILRTNLLLNFADRLKLSNRIVKIPVPAGYFVVARKQ